jgi:hypothetical protein
VYPKIESNVKGRREEESRSANKIDVGRDSAKLERYRRTNWTF